MKYNTRKNQIAKNWAGETKVIVYMGTCVVCGRSLYGYTDQHAPDPRGLINPDHTFHPLNPGDYDMTGNPISMCFTCMNTQDTYNKGFEIAMKEWTPKE